MDYETCQTSQFSEFNLSILWMNTRSLLQNLHHLDCRSGYKFFGRQTYGRRTKKQKRYTSQGSVAEDLWSNWACIEGSSLVILQYCSLMTSTHRKVRKESLFGSQNSLEISYSPHTPTPDGWTRMEACCDPTSYTWSGSSLSSGDWSCCRDNRPIGILMIRAAYCRRCSRNSSERPRTTCSALVWLGQ